MKILYVTGMWSGLRDILINGEKKGRGMPAFLEPLNYLIEEGYQVDLIIGTNEYEREIKQEHSFLKSCNIKLVPWGTGKNKIKLIYNVYKNVLNIAKRDKYDFIYSHGSFGAIGSLAARKLKIPNGQRIYGTFLYNEINHSKISIFLKHPLEYLAFSSKKNFLLITNDGTKGNKVAYKINKKMKVYFWLNGVNKIKNLSKENMVNNTIIYPARIAEWKQQIQALKLLCIMREKGYTNLKLLIVGHITDDNYYKKLENFIEMNKLENQVEYRGEIKQDELYQHYNESLAVLSFYNYSNLGNVVIEALLNGAVVIAKNDGSLNKIIENEKSGYLIDDLTQAAEILEKLINNHKLVRKIRIDASLKAETIFETWEERSLKELLLIEKNVKKFN